MMSFVVILALLTGTSEFTCLAAEDTGKEVEENLPEILEAEVITEMEELMPYTMLAQCIISVSGDKDAMYIDISTGAVGTASVIGVKDIKIQKKVWYGWSTVAICDGAESHDHTMMGISIPYANAEKGATYRITCIHYADVDGYIEGENDTGAFVYDFYQ